MFKQRGQPFNSHSPHKSRLKAVGLNKKARSDGKVSTTLNQVDELGDIRRIVLPVSVNLNIDVITKVSGVLVPSLNSTANT